MYAVPDDPLRFLVLVGMGTVLVVAGLMGGYRAAPQFGLSAEFGAVAGAALGVASGLYLIG